MSSQCALVAYNEVHPHKLSPAFDQTRGVLELQSRVNDSPETRRLLGAICELCALLHLHGGRNLSLSFTISQVATTLLVGNCYRAHIATFLGHLCLYIWLTPINTHIKCHNINVSNGHQWEEQSAHNFTTEVTVVIKYFTWQYFQSPVTKTETRILCRNFHHHPKFRDTCHQ